MTTRRSALQHFALALALAWLPGPASFAQDKAASPRLVLDGYDSVAYFTEKRPLQGTSSITYDWDEGRYQFASAKHRELFAANPDRYLPQFDGLCAAGVAKGKHLKADPTIWRIVDGKLYVFAKQLASEEAFAKAVAVAKTKWKDLK